MDGFTRISAKLLLQPIKSLESRLVIIFFRPNVTRTEVHQDQKCTTICLAFWGHLHDLLLQDTTMSPSLF